jgi:5'(3')-deoxyribonucleotidase
MQQFEIHTTGMNSGKSKKMWYHWLQECQQFAAKKTACTVQGHVTLDCLQFIDESHFHLNGFMNMQNLRFWASENPQSWRHHSILQNAKCGMQSVSKGLWNESLWRAP